jgi:hypothetical protein
MVLSRSVTKVDSLYKYCVGHCPLSELYLTYAGSWLYSWLEANKSLCIDRFFKIISLILR